LVLKPRSLRTQPGYLLPQPTGQGWIHSTRYYTFILVLVKQKIGSGHKAAVAVS